MKLINLFIIYCCFTFSHDRDFFETHQNGINTNDTTHMIILYREYTKSLSASQLVDTLQKRSDAVFLFEEITMNLCTEIFISELNSYADNNSDCGNFVDHRSANRPKHEKKTLKQVIPHILSLIERGCK